MTPTQLQVIYAIIIALIATITHLYCRLESKYKESAKKAEQTESILTAKYEKSLVRIETCERERQELKMRVLILERACPHAECPRKSALPTDK